MTRQLSAPCWYFDGDPWEETPEPHFPSETEAAAHEAEAARLAEREPRVVLRTRAGCWVAQCARCGRPLGGEADDAFTELHHDSELRLLGCLDADGWRVLAGGRVCCPGCAAARPATADVERVAVTIRQAGVTRETVGELTGCPELVITALRDEPDGRWSGLVLTHRGTGRYLPLEAWTTDVGVLHRVAELVSHLDWSPTDPAHYTGYAEPVIAAVNQAIDEHLVQVDS